MSVAESYVSCKAPVVKPKPQSNWTSQMRVLFKRNVRTWVRSPYLMWGFLLQYTFAGIFMGTPFPVPYPPPPSHYHRPCSSAISKGSTGGHSGPEICLGVSLFGLACSSWQSARVCGAGDQFGTRV